MSAVTAKVAKPQSAPAMMFSFPTLRKTEDPVGDQLRMLDHDARIGDDARDQQLAFREPHVVPQTIFILVPSIGCLEGIAARANLEDDVHDIAELHVGGARPHIDAVAGVVTDFVFGDIAQRMMGRLHMLQQTPDTAKLIWH